MFVIMIYFSYSLFKLGKGKVLNDVFMSDVMEKAPDSCKSHRGFVGVDDEI